MRWGDRWVALPLFWLLDFDGFTDRMEGVGLGC